MSAAATWFSSLVFSFGAGTLLIGANILAASATQSPTYTVAMCRATGSTTDPYTAVDADINSIGQISSGTGSANDIIPPFIFGSVVYPGKNWTGKFLAIWSDGCQVAQPNDAAATLHQSHVRSVIGAKPPGDLPDQGAGGLLFVLGLLTMIWAPIAARRRR